MKEDGAIRVRFSLETEAQAEQRIDLDCKTLAFGVLPKHSMLSRLRVRMVFLRRFGVRVYASAMAQ